jgi:hypothetical protein
MDAPTVARIDGNPLATPSLLNALKLAKAFGVSLRELIEEPVPA